MLPHSPNGETVIQSHILTCHADDSKSTGQKVTDSTRSGTDDAQDSGKSIMQSAQENASIAASTVSDTLGSKDALFYSSLW